ncbi:hypothetical protein [Flavobacterium macacae]|uniref:Uncharacterized protein n=1 Tax=Flavobacterium macacae TaxID=2488993 RepID=A0A3P3WH84_9FLAO|nr:hypothetical protein [Flavobacterium macacae]RRJ94124.1 hypothetical protein EG849_01245 [Flavobacterium macacae]
MKLSVTQIDLVYKFTLDHFVKYYDLQTELVDHLGNGIESQWIENPTISFDEALQNEFKKFGVFGFMDVVEQRQSALTKRYNKLVWKHFKAFFAFPKIIMTISLILGLFFILKNILFDNVLISVFVLALLIYSFYNMIKNKKRADKKTQLGGKRWLFKEIIYNYGNSFVMVSLPLQFLIHFPQISIQNNFILFALSTAVVAYYLTTYIMFTIIPAKAEEYLLETYPEYKFSK